eukprot:CAMPEP_0114696120 /NCGR_PEP_ID=MMETSP0191-20121206/72163_1 /TAXON_ID=126664 /ORGANISM="Sorites sp." /LENGTH=127 /DNA_ID=CAMNT_0001993291 /DNA_START=616 /DNA_END=995 /DNA_ORIENTATION=+
MINFEYGGNWFATIPQGEWGVGIDKKVIDEIKQDFDGEYGDRRQELVYIGSKDMDIKKLTQQLDACLLNDDEYKKGENWWNQNIKDVLELGFNEMDEQMHDGHDHDNRIEVANAAANAGNNVTDKST